MATEERQLPLFPLNVVLFPNATMPLQIFEERYKLMLDACLKADSQFGVVLIRSGPEVGGDAVPHAVGTVARILQVNRVKEGGSFISIVGRRRFEIQRVVQQRPYLEATVTLLEEDQTVSLSQSELAAMREAVTLYVRLAMGLRGGWICQARIPSDPTTLSYHLPGLLAVSAVEKQALLEQASTLKRLELEMELLERESETLRERVENHLGRLTFSRQ